MGLLEPLTHKKEIKELLDEAQFVYDNAQGKFEEQKEKTGNCLEDLGQIKVKAWSEGMDSFVNTFNSFNHLEVIKTIDTNLTFIGSDEEPQQMIINMQQATLTATEVKKIGIAAIGSSALIGIATYGGVMMFGKASTGTAIRMLTGVAKKNATLAWLGGGSKAIGGLGMLGGKIVLGGLILAPLLAIPAIIGRTKAKEQLAEARKINAEAKDAAEKMNQITISMEGIEKMSKNYILFIKKFAKKFQPFVDELERIKSAHPIKEGELIDFNDLSSVEQKTLHLAWLMAQIYYRVLSTPLMTADGIVSTDAAQVITTAEKDYKKFWAETFKMTGEDAQAANIFWRSSAKKMLILNLYVMFALLALAIMVFSFSTTRGLIFIVAAVIAFPYFLVIKVPSESRLWLWRIYRLVGAIAFAIIMQFLV